jgi:hypothetical protein
MEATAPLQTILLRMPEQTRFNEIPGVGHHGGS